MKLSLVIPTYKRNRSLLNLLASIETHQGFDCLYETLIISNGPDPFFSSKEFLEKNKLWGAQVFYAPSIGVNVARNLGLLKACGDIVLFFDDDCEITDSNYFNKIIHYHTQNPAALAVGGLYSLPQKPQPIDIAYALLAREWQFCNVSHQLNRGQLVGGNVSYKKVILKKVGEVFDPSISFGGAELEFHQRLLRKGCKLLLFKDISVCHRTNLDLKSFCAKARAQGRTKARFDMDSSWPFREKNFLYQSPRDLWAWELAESKGDFIKIIGYMNLYTETFLQAAHNKPKKQARLFSKQKKTGALSP